MRKYNFYPGPATIPTEVLETYREELLEYGDCGASFVEISHHCPEIHECHDRVVAAIRSLLGAGDDYHVLLLPGGSHGMVAAIPMNVVAEDGTASVAVTGHWSNMASNEMAKFCEIHRCADNYPDCVTVPDPAKWDVATGSRFVFLTENETIQGIEFAELPDFGDVPLVLDQSSNILSRPIDLANVGVLFACLQKNLGPSGLAVLVVRKDLCESPRRATPIIWEFNRQAGIRSMANTMPTHQLRMLELMLDWIVRQGGLEKLDEVNRAKAKMLYDFIDGSGYYKNKVDPRWRSRMNVTFTLPDAALDGAFVSGAFDAGMVGVKGHFTVGGMRASIYNAMPVAGVEALVGYMREFASRNG